MDSTVVSLYEYDSYFINWFWMCRNESVIQKMWQWWNMGVKCLPKTIDKNCERDMNSVIIIIKIFTFHLHSTLQQNDLQSSFQMVLGRIGWMSPRESLLGWDSAAHHIVYWDSAKGIVTCTQVRVYFKANRNISTIFFFRNGSVYLREKTPLPPQELKYESLWTCIWSQVSVSLWLHRFSQKKCSYSTVLRKKK